MQHGLINLLEYSNLHGLITSCMFINFGKFPSKIDFFTIDFWKIPTCMVLLHPACLSIFGNFQACMIITSCTLLDTLEYPRRRKLMEQSPASYLFVCLFVEQYIHNYIQYMYIRSCIYLDINIDILFAHPKQL